MVLAVACAAGCSGPTRNVQASMNRYRIAEDEFKKRELPAATTDAKAALHYDDSNADAYNLLGLINLQKGIDDLDLGEKSRCERGPVGVQLREEATTYFAEAAKFFQKAVAARPDYAEAFNNLASVHIFLHHYDEAIGYANRALEYAPHLLRVETARANLGWAYYYKKDYVHAEEALLQSVSHEPNFCLGAYRLAKVQWDQQRPGRAIEVLEHVVKQANCPILEAHYLLGLAFVSEHKDGRARSWFTSCAKLEPNSCLADECKKSLALLPDVPDETEPEPGSEDQSGGAS